jgi:hypothetical protein
VEKKFQRWDFDRFHAGGTLEDKVRRVKAREAEEVTILEERCLP